MKVLLGVLATILALSVSYYFAVELPAHNRAVLDFEREKYRTSQQEKKAKEAEETNLRRSADEDLLYCTAAAETAYTNEVKANGTPGARGTYTVPTATITVIQQKRTQALNECQKEFDRKTKNSR